MRGFVVALALLASFARAEAVPDSWPTFHGGYGLTGHSAAQFTAKPARLWRFKAAGPVTTTPVAGAGRIYCLAGDCTVAALDVSGNKVWETKLGVEPTPETTPPAPRQALRITAPLLFAGGCIVAVSDDGEVYVLDAATGAVKWKKPLGVQVQGQPNFAQAGGRGVVLILDQAEGVLQALDLADGQVVWTAEPVDRTDGHVSVGGGRAVVGSCDSAVHGLSVADGRESALVSMGEGKEMAGGAAVDGDFAFIGNRAGGLACIDFKTGESPWESEESEGELFTTPAVAGELVVYSGGDGNVHAVKRDGGAKVWTYESGGMVALSPVIAGEHVAVAIDGVLHLVSLKKGRKEWSFQVSDHVTSPAVTAGMLIVGTDDGYVLAFGSPGKVRE